MAKKTYEDYLKELREESKNLTYQPRVHSHTLDRNSSSFMPTLDEVNSFQKVQQYAANNKKSYAQQVAEYEESISKTNKERANLLNTGGKFGIDYANSDGGTDMFATKYNEFKRPTTKSVDQRDKNLPIYVKMAERNKTTNNGRINIPLSPEQTSLISGRPEYENINKRKIAIANETQRQQQAYDENVDQKEVEDFRDRLLRKNAILEYSKNVAKSREDKSNKGKYTLPFLSGLDNAITPFRSNKFKNENGDIVSLPTYNDIRASEFREKSDSNIYKAFSDVSQSVGNMVPGIAAGTLSGGLGSAVFGVNTYANAKNQALLEGYNSSNASAYAAVNTGLELAVGKLLGGASAVMGKSPVAKEIGAKFTSKIMSNPVLASVTADMMSEFGEEYVQEWLDPKVKAYLLDNKNLVESWDSSKFIDKQNLYAGLLGALSAGIMNTPGAVKNQININNQIDSIVQLAEQEKGTKLTTDEKKSIKSSFNNEYNKAIKNQTEIDYENVLPGLNNVQSRTLENLSLPGINKYSIQEENSNNFYEYKPSENTKIDNLRKDIADLKWNNSEQTNNYVKMLEQIISDKGVDIRFDSNLTDSQGRFANGKYENGVITINPNSNRAGEFIAIHELTHAIGTKSMRNIVENYRKSNAEFDKAVTDLLGRTYKTNELTEEAMADVAGQLFGNQEFINNLAQSNPSVFKILYNNIKYLWHQFRGYKNQNQFIEDLQWRWEQAYRSNKELNNTQNNSNVEMSNQVDDYGEKLSLEQAKYFKNSKIRNDNGNLKTLFHGTNNYDFNEFEGGTFLTDDYMNADGYASGERVIESYVNMENPLIIDCKGAKWDNLNTPYGTSTREIAGKLDGSKYDGVIFENINDAWYDDENGDIGTVYYVPNSNQIKETSNLNPSKSPDIRYSKNENNSLSKQLEKQGTKILEESELKRQGMIDNFKTYLEENNITNPTQEDIDNSIVDLMSYDNEQSATDNARDEKLYNKYVREYMKENNIKFNESKVGNNNNIEYNNEKGSVVNDNRTSEINRRNTILRDGSTNTNGRNNISNKQQEDIETNKYVYSPESYKYDSRSINEIFGENAKTNENNKGTKLTKDQNDFYKDVKIRNADGNLMVVYHGTNKTFDSFDKNKIGSNTHNRGMFGEGFYFTDNNALATSYNWDQNVSKDYEPMALYLNIKNPFFWNNIKTIEEMQNFSKEIGLKDGVLEWNPYQQEMHVIRDAEKANEFSKALQKNGYDGIVYKYDHGQTTAEIVAFEPNQIKSIDNLNPTNSDNIYDNNNKELGNSSFSNEKNYRGSHQIENAKPITELNVDDITTKIKDIDGYLTNQSESDLRKLKKILNNPNEKVTIYRASPVNELNSGDWVTTDKSYAKNVANNNGGKVYSYEVNANELYYPDNVNDLPSLHRLSSFQYNENTQNNVKYSLSNEDTRYSKQNKSWQEYLEDNFESTGTKTNMKDLKLPTSKKILPKSSENTSENSSETALNIPKKVKTMNPIEISNLTENNANTTPNLPYRSRNKSSDGESKFFDNILYKTDMLDTKSKKAILESFDTKYYDKITNKESLETAYNKLNKNGQMETMRWFNNNSENANATDVAEGWILLKQYADNGNTEGMVEAAKKLREIGTKAGQTIQAFNIMERMTPEGMVAYAQSELSEAYDNMVKGKSKEWIDKYRSDFDLKPEEVQFIMNNMEEVSKMEDGYEKRVKLAEIQKLMTDKLPAEKGKKIKSWMRISMLFNPKTQVRNVVGNAIIMPVNAFGDLFSSYYDKLISKSTGVRTTGLPNVKSILKGMKEGAFQATNDYKKGINTKDMEGNRFEIGEGKSFNDKTLMGKSLNRVDGMLNYIMDAGDRIFSQSAFENSLKNQMVLNHTNKITQDMIDIARSESLQRTWNDNNEYTRFVLNARAGLNKIMNNQKVLGYGLGDVLIPFAKTPANLTKAIVDYSPVGLVESAFKFKKLKNAIETNQFTPQIQHEFVQGLGKAAAGTMLYVLGAALAKSGIISGESDDDKDTKDFLKNALGVSSYSIKIGDKSFTYDWAQPIAAPFSIMANIEKKKNDQKTALLEGTLSSLDSASSILLEQSFLQSINEVLTNNKGIVSGLENVVLDLPARSMPTFLKQITDMTDGTQRQTYEYDQPLKTAVNKFKVKLPGLSKTLAPKVDTMGREVQKYGGKNNIFNVFLNPANVNTENISEGAKEIYDVYKATGKKEVMPKVAPYYVKDNGEKVVLDTKQVAEYQKIAGKAVEKSMNKLLKDSTYKNMTDLQKADVISDIVNYSAEIAKNEVTNIPISKKYGKAYGYSEVGDVSDYYMMTNSIDNSSSVAKRKSIVKYLTDSNLSDKQIATLYGGVYSKEQKLKNIENANIPMKEYIKFDSADIDGTFDTKTGRTKTGSQKNAVIEYVNGLNLSIPQKAFLIRSRYSTFKSYDDQIINYVNNLDISKIDKYKLIKMVQIDSYNSEIVNYVQNQSMTKHDKEELLKEMKFKIYNGKVYYK